MPALLPSAVEHVVDRVLTARQDVQTVGAQATPTNCGGEYSGGVLAGAIMGTFFGTLLLVYLFSTIGNFGRGGGGGGGRETVVVEKRRSGSRRHRSRSGSSSVRRPSRVYTTG